MRTLLAWPRRLAAVFFPGRGDREIANELESHLQLHIDDNVRAGMTPAEARRHAVMKLGGLQQSTEMCRDQAVAPFVESIVKDAAHGLRVLASHRGFTAAAITILGLGIGANTAIFTLVNTVMLRPLPFPEPSRLVSLWHVPPPHLFGGRHTFAVSPANYLDWRDEADVFERMAVYRSQRMTLTGEGEPAAVSVTYASEDFFATLRAAPLAGRAFDAADAAAGHTVVLLKERFWKTRFGGDPRTIGRTVLLDGRPYTVIGIVPDRVALPDTAAMWTPLVWSPAERTVRGNHRYAVIARLKPDVDLTRAQGEMMTISKRLEQQYPADNQGWGATAIPLQEDLYGDGRPALLVLMGAVGLVALIACANVANLLLARTLARGKELAVRSALGASRGRVIRQLVTESLLLGLGGALVGTFIGYVGLAALKTWIGERLARADEMTLDAEVLAFTVCVAVVSGLVAGALPAWRLTGRRLGNALTQRDGSHAGQRRVRNGLVTAEVAIAIVLLVGAGLLIRTLTKLRAVDPGIDAANVLTFGVVLPPAQYPELRDQTQFFDAALAHLRALPGVTAAGGADDLPLDGGSTQPVAVEGRAAAPLSEQPEVQVRKVTPGYLDAMRMRLLAGRAFTDADAQGRPLVALISESAARRFWPDGNPIGRHLTLGLMSEKAPREVVGVVNDVKLLGLDVDEPVAAVYLPIAQNASPGLSFVVRTAGPPERVATAAARAIRDIDPDRPVLNVATMDAVIGASIEQQRYAMFLLLTFALLALTLAGIGIFSVLSYNVSERRAELGIRMALGAPVESVVRDVVADGLKPTAAGLAIGIVAALALGGALQALLFGVGARDTATLAAVSAIVTMVSVTAALVPARRATLIDPMLALRSE